MEIRCFLWVFSQSFFSTHFFQGGSEPFQGVQTPLDPPMLLVHTD